MKKNIVYLLSALLLISMVAGVSVLGISKIDFSFNGDKFSNQWLLLIADDNRGDELAISYLDSEDLKDGDIQARYDTTISVEPLKKQCVYNVKSSSEPIRLLSYYTFSTWDFWKINEKTAECEQRNGYYAWILPDSFIGDKGFCFYTTTDSIVGYIPSKKYSFLERIAVSSNGVTKTAQLSNDPNLAGVSANIPNYLDARWNGNLGTGSECPTILDKTPIYDQSNSRWNLGLESNIQTYRSYHLFGGKDCLEDFFALGTKSAQQCVDEYNRFSAQAKAPVSFSIAGSSGTLTTKSSSDGELIVNDVDAYQIPVITLKLNARADWVGVLQPVTNPTIRDLKSVQFQTGDQGYITAEIRNTGASGSVSVQTSCESPFRVEGTTRIYKIDAGETITVNVPITATAPTDTSAQCTVTVTDESDPSISDSSRVTVRVSPITVCDPLSRRCNGKNIEICNNAGTDYEVEKVCDGICEEDENLFKCAEEGKDDGVPKEDCKWYDLKCHFEKAGFLTIVNWIMAILGTLIVMFQVSKFAQSRKLDRIWTVIFSIAFGFASFILIILYFWWAVLGVVLLLLLLGWLVFILPPPSKKVKRAIRRVKRITRR